MSGALFRQERIIALLVNKVTCFLHVYRDLESLIDKIGSMKTLCKELDARIRYRLRMCI